mgnify:CR=1 FL=1
MMNVKYIIRTLTIVVGASFLAPIAAEAAGGAKHPHKHEWHFDGPSKSESMPERDDPFRHAVRGYE